MAIIAAAAFFIHNATATREASPPPAIAPAAPAPATPRRVVATKPATTQATPQMSQLLQHAATSQAIVEVPPPLPAQPPTEPASQPATTAATEPAPAPSTSPAPPLPRIHPVRPTVDTASVDLDDQIGQSIRRGVDYLLNRMKTGRLQKTKDEEIDNDTLAGLDALVVYALLHAGEATNDERLGPHTTIVDDMLKVLKALPADHGPATYARALRAAALGVYNRGEDRTSLQADATWLLKANIGGAYSYELPRPGMRGTRGVGENEWDNSNSQYGALGVWSADEAGVSVPQSYWTEVEQHWLGCQLPSGEWAYAGPSEFGRLSMTVAGITTLFVTQDQLSGSHAANVSVLGQPPFTRALARGLQWLESGDNSVTLPLHWRTYNLYGLERAALASGFKYFGTHDWYRELAKDALLSQRPDGSWFTADTNTDEAVDTAFTLLFLSRGRHPIFMNKLRYDGFWANRPRDAANLTRFATHELERPLNWQVVNLSGDWIDWMDSPVLYMAGHQPPKLEQSDYAKLKAYAENGGLIFTHADGDSADFTRFAQDLARHLFPQYALQDLPPTHEIYTTLYKLKAGPRLQGVSNGSRLLLLHSPTDLNKAWQLRDWKPRQTPFEMGLNTFIYAAGTVNLRNKLHTPYVPEPGIAPLATVNLPRLRYDGNWDPEPAAWSRFGRQFLGATSIDVRPTPIDVADLRVNSGQLAHLTGTSEVHFSDDQIAALRNYVNAGGVLLIDACGGSTAFAQSIRAELLPRAFPDGQLKRLRADHPILSGDGGADIEGLLRITPHLRPHATELLGITGVPIETLTAGRGCVIFTGVDLTTGLLGTNTYSVIGCDPETATPLCRNILLWALQRD